MVRPGSDYQSLPAQYGRLISASMPCEGVTLAAFLRHAAGQPRFYWESSRDAVAFAGFGSAVELMAWGPERFRSIRHQAAELFTGAEVLDEEEVLAAPRLFGGFAFRDDFVPDYAWSDFPPAHFVLPHYQMVMAGGTPWLTINAHIPFGENPRLMLTELQEALQARIELLRQDMPAPKTSPVLQELRYPMSFEQWQTMIESATGRINGGELKKVVLARAAELRFDTHAPVDAALDYLNTHYADSTRFLFEPRPYHAFFGATPELLAEVRRGGLRTMGLAGSIRRGQTPEEDEAMAVRLLNDPKEATEHEIVVERLRERLEPLTEALSVGTRGILRLRNIQHLYTPVSGQLRQHGGVLPVVEALHPTPALGGDPADIAMQVIRDSEPVPRGWYAAPVGWIDRELDGAFAVAIRSAVAQDRRVWLYAGAGIVGASEPQREWDETALKFRPMLEALGASEALS